MKHIDNLTYKTFVNKFNDTYKNSLKENQKKLLTNYIVSFSDNGLGLKSFVNEEVGNLKQKLSEKLSSGKDTFSEEKREKLQKVSVVLEDFSKKPLDEKLVKKVILYPRLGGGIIMVRVNILKDSGVDVISSENDKQVDIDIKPTLGIKITNSKKYLCF